MTSNDTPQLLVNKVRMFQEVNKYKKNLCIVVSKWEQVRIEEEMPVEENGTISHEKLFSSTNSF